MARYYEVEWPDGQRLCTRGVRQLRNLPEGTRAWRMITERDGTVVECDELEVRDGRVQIRGHGVRKVPMHWG